MFRGAPVVDADSHKIENPVIFPDYVEAPFRGRVRVVTDDEGEQRLAIVDRSPETGSPELVRLYPQPRGPGRGAFRALPSETTMGAVFNRLRIAHMDRERIDVQVLFGSLPLVFASLRDTDLAVALCHAYNNYIHDDCEPHRERIVPIGAIPVQDVPEAIAEMHRCVEQLGMPGICLPPNLPVSHPEAPDRWPEIRGLRPLSDPALFGIYEAAQDLGVPVCVHGAAGAYLCGGAGDEAATYALAHLLGHRSQQQSALAHLVLNGILQRFPRLRIAFLGAGCGWIPDLFHALREHWERRERSFDPSFYPSRSQFTVEVLRERNDVRRFGLARRARNLFRMRHQTRTALHAPPQRDAASLHEHPGLTRDPIDSLARVYAGFAPEDPAPAYLRTALGPVGMRLPVLALHHGHWDGTARNGLRRVTDNADIDPDHAIRLISTNALELYGPRLRTRIEPLLRKHRLQIAGPESA